MKRIVPIGAGLLALLALGGTVFYGTQFLFMQGSTKSDEIETVSPAYDDDFEKIKESEIKLPGPLNKLFGPVKLTNKKSPTGVSAFKAQFPTKPIMLGPIGLDSGLITIKGKSASFALVIKLFDKKFKTTLKKFTYVPASKLNPEDLFPQGAASKEKRRFHLQECVFELTPLTDADRLDLGGLAGIDKMELVFEEGKEAALRVAVKLFDQPIVFSASIGDATEAKEAAEVSKYELYGDASIVFRAELPKRKLSELLPFIKGTAFDFLSYGGKTEFVLADITKSKKAALLKEAEKSKLKLRGILSLVGNLSADANSNVAKIMGLDFSELAATVDLFNKRAAITGKTTVLGLILKGKFLLDIGVSPARILFASELAAPINEWKPFEQMPGLKELESVRNTALTEVKAGVELLYNGAAKKATGKSASTTDTSFVFIDEKGDEMTATAIADSSATASAPKSSLGFYISGRGNILGINSEMFAKVSVIEGAGIGLTLMAALPNGAKMSMVFPELFKNKNPVTEALDLFQLSETYIAIATQRDPFLDLELGINFKTGISFTGDNPIAKILQGFAAKSVEGKSDGPGFRMSGHFDPLSILNMKLKVGLTTGGENFGLTIGTMLLRSGAVNIVLRGEPAVGIEGAFFMVPEPGAVPLLFAGEVTFSEQDVGFVVSMRDLWKNPFGIKGLEIGNLALRDTVSYQAIGETIATGGAAAGSLLIPGKFGLAGELKIGITNPIGLKLFFVLGTDIKNTFIDAKVENVVTLYDFARALAEQFKVQDFYDKFTQLVPPSIIDYAWLKFAPGGAAIGNVVINAGVGGGFGFVLFGVPFKLVFSLDTKGIYGEGSLGKIDLGPLKIMGATGGDSAVRFAVHTEKGVEFVVDSRVALLDVFNSLVRIQLSAKGLAFETDFALGPQEMGMNMHVKATTIDFTDPSQTLKALSPEQLKLTIEFSQTFTDQLKRTIDTELTKARDQLQRDMNNTIEQLGRNAIDQDINNQQAIVNQKNSARFPYPWWPPLRIIEFWRAEAEFVGESAKLILLQLKAAVERTALGQFMRDVMDKLGVTQFLQNSLRTIRDLGIGVFEQGRFVFNNIGNIATVKRVFWSGSVADIKTGVLPGVMVTFAVAGKEETRNLGQFNLKDPVASINAVSQNIVALASEAILQSLPH